MPAICYLILEWFHLFSALSLMQTALFVCTLFVVAAVVALWRAKRVRIVVEYDSRE